jgi:hypothetical protein
MDKKAMAKLKRQYWGNLIFGLIAVGVVVYGVFLMVFDHTILWTGRIHFIIYGTFVFSAGAVSLLKARQLKSEIKNIQGGLP